MSDDLTVDHGDCRHGGGQRWGESRLFSRIRRKHPLAGNPGCRDRPERRAQTLRIALALPGSPMPPGRSVYSIATREQRFWSEIAGLRSPTPLPASCSCRAGRRSWRRTRSGPCPRRRRPAFFRQAVGQTRAGRGGGTHRRDLRRPKGPKVSASWPPSRFHLHGQLSRSAVMARYPVRACTGSPLRCLSEASRSRRSLSHATARAGRSLRPNWRDRSCTGSSRKSLQNDLTLARHRPSQGQVPAGLPAKAWPGENGDEPSSRSIYHRPINSNFLLRQAKLSVMFRSSLDTSIKPILCPRKSGPTHFLMRRIRKEPFPSIKYYATYDPELYDHQSEENGQLFQKLEGLRDAQ